MSEGDEPDHFSQSEPPPRILIVEDNPVNQEVARRMLDRLGYEADVAWNGAEAVRAISRTSYAAVLMDCEMPVMDGFAATREIRQLTARESPPRQHLPIIAFTARTSLGDRRRCLASGMDAVLGKPVSLADLKQTLDRWVTPSTRTTGTGPGHLSG